MLQEGLVSLLLSEPTITDLIGTPETRSDLSCGVSWGQMPDEQTSMPAIVLSRITGEGEQTHDGVDGFHRSRIQVSCYAMDYPTVARLQAAVKRLLEGWPQNASPLPVLADGTVVYSIFLLTEMDGFEEAPDVYHCPSDYEFAYREP